MSLDDLEVRLKDWMRCGRASNLVKTESQKVSGFSGASEAEIDDF